MGKHQSAGLHEHKWAAVICLGEEVSTVINLQRQQSLKFDFKEMVKSDCESYRAQDSNTLSVCDINYVYLEKTQEAG